MPTTRESVHRLIDEFPEEELTRAERVLEALLDIDDHSVVRALRNAPVDDEPETPEERAAVAEAWVEHRRGEGLTTEELRRDLGLR